MESIAVNTIRSRHAEANRLARERYELQQAEAAGAMSATETIAMERWVRVREVGIKTIDVLAKHNFAGGSVEQVVTGYRKKRFEYLPGPVTEERALWKLQTRLPIFVFPEGIARYDYIKEHYGHYPDIKTMLQTSEGQKGTVYLGDDANLYVWQEAAKRYDMALPDNHIVTYSGEMSRQLNEQNVQDPEVLDSIMESLWLLQDKTLGINRAAIAAKAAEQPSKSSERAKKIMSLLRRLSSRS